MWILPVEFCKNLISMDSRPITLYDKLIYENPFRLLPRISARMDSRIPTEFLIL